MTGPVPARFCYVVFAHHEPALVLRLVRRIRELSPRSTVVVRHSEPPGFLSAAELAVAGAELMTSDIAMRWGSWGMVAGMVEALRWVRARAAGDWVVAISGQDYPVLDLPAWERDLAAGQAEGLVDADRLVDTSRYRYRFSYVTGARAAAVDRLLRGPIRRVVRAAWWYGSARWQQVVWVTHLPRGLGYGIGVRRPASAIDRAGCWKGSQWFTLSTAVVDGVLALHDGRPELREHFRHTYIPDEAYLQTLAHLTGQPVRTGRTTWTRFVGREAHPRPVDDDAVSSARAAGVPFVRKVDPADTALLDRIDATVASR